MFFLFTFVTIYDISIYTLAFIQHMIASLNADGMMGVVVPHGVLFRGSSEKAIRKGILDDDLLEGVIGFVPQDDLLIEELSVFENLYYNGKLC